MMQVYVGCLCKFSFIMVNHDDDFIFPHAEQVHHSASIKALQAQSHPKGRLLTLRSNFLSDSVAGMRFFIAKFPCAGGSSLISITFSMSGECRLFSEFAAGFNDAGFGVERPLVAVFAPSCKSAFW